MKAFVQKFSKALFAFAATTILLAACESDIIQPDHKLGTPDKSKLIIPKKDG